MKKIISLLVIVAIFVASCTPQPTNNKYCETDDDCVKVQEGCCNCNNGGKAIAINKEYKQEWLNNISKECGDVMCATVISNDWSCTDDAEARCLNSICELV